MSKRILLTSFVALCLVCSVMAVAEADTHTITYTAGQGGVGADQTQTVTFGDTFTTKPANTFSKPNATFAGWQSVETSSSWTQPNTTYTYDINGDITMRALWTCDNGYSLNSVPDLKVLIGETYGTDYGYVNHSGIFDNDGSNATQAGLGISNADTWSVIYDDNKGKITGKAICSTQPGTNDWDGNATTATNVTGDFTNGYQCWCQIDSYAPNSGSATALSAPWVFYSDLSSASNCADSCAFGCVRALQGYAISFRDAVFGSLNAGACEGNTITVQWSDTTQAEIDANNAGTITYGGDIRTPRSATQIQGKRFKGWRFVASGGSYTK